MEKPVNLPSFLKLPAVASRIRCQVSVRADTSNNAIIKRGVAMTQWQSFSLALVMTGALATTAWGQLPAGPPAAPAAAPAGAPAAAPAAPAGPNLFAMLGLTKENFVACRECFCSHPLGQLLNSMVTPMSGLTGGIVPPLCPPPPTMGGKPSAEDLAKPPGSAAGAAARVQADEAGAKARREAVRYLGTVDCHYWPEAEAALINALRADRNECVRYEAALALGRGCCCTKNTVAALMITVTGSDKDKNPAETSERVKSAAYEALQRCLNCLPAADVEQPEVPEKPEPLKVKPPETPGGDQPQAILDTAVQQAAYSKPIDSQPNGQLLERARRLVYVGSSKEGYAPPTGQRSVYHIFTSAFARREVSPSASQQEQR